MRMEPFPRWPLAVLAAALAAVTLLAIRPYGWNVTSLFHLDRGVADRHAVPAGFVVLEMPGYDGAQYYEMARHMPEMFLSSRWEAVRALPPGAYAYQRFLLPLLAFAVSLGSEAALPYAFVGINVAALLAACVAMLKTFPGKPLYALALTLSPAAMVGMHLVLAEPLTILLLTVFLTRYRAAERLDALGLLMLSLLVLTREVNILFIGLLGLYALVRLRWKDCALLLIPVATFCALHGFIFALFRDVPFLWSADKRGLPGWAILEILLGRKGYNVYTLSSIALFLGFVLPGALWLLKDIGEAARRKSFAFIPLAGLAFFAVMVAMPDHIWSSITSIGRVITPIYPLVLVHAAAKDTLPARVLALSILALGCVAGIGLALIAHPFSIA
jgi:hypothetical protein